MTDDLTLSERDELTVLRDLAYRNGREILRLRAEVTYLDDFCDRLIDLIDQQEPINVIQVEHEQLGAAARLPRLDRVASFGNGDLN